MDIFKASEILEICVRIEENGERLYRHAQTLTDDKKIKDLFGFLASEEIEHKKIFQDMAAEIEHYEPPQSYPGEYLAYLRAYTANIVFPADELEEDLEDLDDAEDAVEFAIQRELESILYYLETKNLVPKNQTDTIDKIIDEERKHYLRLIEVKKTLD